MNSIEIITGSGNSAKKKRVSVACKQCNASHSSCETGTEFN